MSLLSYVQPAEASGMVAEVYKRFPPKAGIPAPVRLLSVSPGLLANQVHFLTYYRTHERLDQHFLTMLRFLVFTANGFASCEHYNRTLLVLMGMSEAEVDALAADPASAPLDDSHKALLLFAFKSVTAPQDVTPKDTDDLRAMGWTDQDILDACFHGAQLLGPAVLCRAFGVE